MFTSLHFSKILKYAPIIASSHGFFRQETFLIPSQNVQNPPFKFRCSPANIPLISAFQSEHQIKQQVLLENQGINSPSKWVKCISVSLSHVPDLSKCELVRYCTSILAKHVLKICRYKTVVSF